MHNLPWGADARTQKSLQSVGQFCGGILFVAQCNSTNDPNGYYHNITDCINHFYNIYDWGTFGVIRSNTSICRIFHTSLAIGGRPQVHCPIIGKTGGGKCTPHDEDDYYLQDF